jgi:NAD(P)-dependent dehydrogenase (short-subunit alcohol dehydrogenase family)
VASRGINVNAISPAVIETDMTRDLIKHFSSEDIAKFIPKGRWCRPADIAELVLFLVSEKSNFITGEVVALDGGFSI